ncbi:uncharacterized protein L969DRAFT_96428 [Mixia osmundae IAM 14324]|uniref:Peroxisomal membrane protein PEX13 n=1 Tax=Mixia osmundae (strain CBS 9802 / IAM 14324 / JCM 22182 / KY 12970) TaxID=764103 RepID=G7DWI8_MIXOS|nr:uncharacterized protein L969DRAFT_96428 [Mixia osmundae IAM 14324]KEI37349.1 hypothetical protein L969DRAFT_96428 [Mixia osmundae IAM 14324]GAA94948.1 hypothetical protein E5Q_01603 [Mixia osmundae IAM 14324]
MPSPPKPWERGNGASTTTMPSGHGQGGDPARCPAVNPSAATGVTQTASALDSSVPALPARPATMTAAGSQAVTPYGAANSAYSPYGGAASRYGSTMGTMGSYGGYGSSYTSPYSRMGSSYGGMGMGMGGYGGYGGMGGMGGYGMGMGGYGMGMGGFGAGMGMPGGPGDPSLTQRMEAGTQATFQIIESIVGAFGGFAQMLESTFMATHSSFFAMIGVAEQFGHLRNYLGQVLSIFTLIRWLRSMLNRVLGREDPLALMPSGNSGQLTADGFRAFEATGQVAGPSMPGQAGVRPSRKPIVMFFLTVVGLPYLMNRFVRMINARQEEEARLRGELPPGQQGLLMGPDGQPLPTHMQPPHVQGLPGGAPEAIDPATLTFVRAVHPHTTQDPLELNFNSNDIIAVLTPPAERQEPGWWRGRMRDGRIGWFPSTHVAELPSNNKVADKPVKPVNDSKDQGKGAGDPPAGGGHGAIKSA